MAMVALQLSVAEDDWLGPEVGSLYCWELAGFFSLLRSFRNKGSRSHH